jgi:hypothetical protein
MWVRARHRVCLPRYLTVMPLACQNTFTSQRWKIQNVQSWIWILTIALPKYKSNKERNSTFHKKVATLSNTQSTLNPLHCKKWRDTSTDGQGEREIRRCKGEKEKTMYNTSNHLSFETWCKTAFWQGRQSRELGFNGTLLWRIDKPWVMNWIALKRMKQQTEGQSWREHRQTGDYIRVRLHVCKTSYKILTQILLRSTGENSTPHFYTP